MLSWIVCSLSLFVRQTAKTANLRGVLKTDSKTSGSGPQRGMLNFFD